MIFPGRFAGPGMFFLGLLLIGLSACTPKSSHLRPLSDPSELDPSKKQVKVGILPIDTFGFGNKQKRRIGMDLSGFFTVFEVEVRNRTDRPVGVDPLASVLDTGFGRVLTPLSVEEALAYYRETPRTVAAMEREEKIIKNLFMAGETLQPGEDTQGMVYFKKVPPGDCRRVKLSLEGIRISGEEQGRTFEFEFLCPSRP